MITIPQVYPFIPLGDLPKSNELPKDRTAKALRKAIATRRTQGNYINSSTLTFFN